MHLGAKHNYIMEFAPQNVQEQLRQLGVDWTPALAEQSGPFRQRIRCIFGAKKNIFGWNFQEQFANLICWLFLLFLPLSFHTTANLARTIGWPRNTNLRGRVSTVDLLTKSARSKKFYLCKVAVLNRLVQGGQLYLDFPLQSVFSGLTYLKKTQIQSKVTLTSAAMVTILFEVIWFISPKEF